MDLLIYTREITPRVEYIFRFIFKDILRLKYRITTSITEVQDYRGPVLSYSHQHIGNAVHIIPHGLLTEDGIKQHSFEAIDWDGIPAFPLTANNTETPFDIFAASFYLVTRYEEYIGAKKFFDKHSRYDHTVSLASRYNFLHLPIVDMWSYKLLSILKAKNYVLSIKSRKFNHITTVDLDSAYAYKHKGVVRVAVSAIKSLLTAGKPDFVNRFRVMIGRSPDPYDIYNDLLPILPDAPQTIWFIHTGKWGRYDKSISSKTPAIRKLINTLGERFRIGIHPSYSSFHSERKVREELSSLVDALNQSVACSRQHYLRLSLPVSYQILVNMGITEDYTMGYSTTIGFRAGTCTPFTFYDLAMEQMLNLKVFLFGVMDSTLVAQNVAPNDADGHIRRLIDSVKQVEGTFISIWHIDYLSGHNHSKDWINSLKVMQNYLSGLSNAH